MGKKKTVRTFRKMKMDGEKIVMLTAYDALTSAMAQAADIDLLLIGDSVGPTVMGYSDTVPVTVEDMIHHGKWSAAAHPICSLSATCRSFPIIAAMMMQSAMRDVVSGKQAATA